MRYKYTDDDIEFLKIHYPIGDWDSIQKRFPNITREGIYKKCFRMGIVSNNEHRKHFDISETRRKWSNEEVEIIKKYYSIAPIDKVQMLLPNRTLDMIRTKASALNLVSFYKKHSIWKKEDLDYIVENWETTPDKIMAKHLDRTFRSVKYKREELGLYRQDKNDNSYPTLSKYLRGQNQLWKKKSMESCDYKCVLTGSKNFEIHHLFGASNIINDILNDYPQYKSISFDGYTENDLSFFLQEFLRKQDEYPLGVCVDKKLHVLFHSMYGQYYNTPEQWYKFCEDYRKGIYNSV